MQPLSLRSDRHRKGARSHFNSSQGAETLKPLHNLDTVATDKERGFENLLQVVGELFEVPIALVAFVEGDRVFLQSTFGSDLAGISDEADFCAEVAKAQGCIISNRAPFREGSQAPDAVKILFAAGAPVFSPLGDAIGALCVFDRSSREFTPLNREHLETLAAIASEKLELHQLREFSKSASLEPNPENWPNDSAERLKASSLHIKRALKNVQMEAELLEAIENDHLVLHYQPEVDLATKEVIGFEALVRWRHPERGLIPPNEFIPIAEETGLILPLGEWGLKEACRQISEWRSIRVRAEVELRVSVNLSAKQFSSPNLPKQISKVLDDTGLFGTDLRLEITESCLMSDADAALAMLSELRDIGVGLQMDDFGTGYSSLNYLHRFPFDTLKIDRSFVQDICESRHSWQIVRSIVDLARSLKLNVVAEGIETEDQLSSLQKLGCRFGQGYLFAKPLAASTISSLLQSQAMRSAPFYFPQNQ